MRRAWPWVGAVLVALLASAPWRTSVTPTLLWVLAPSAGAIVGVAGVPVMVRFPEQGRVVAGSLRVLLNGADVTGDVTTGENGAAGRLHGVLEGENVLRVQVTGDRGGGHPEVRLEEAREIRFLVRLPQHLDRG